MASASPQTVAFSQSMHFRPHENPQARGSRFPGGDGSGTKGPSPKPHGLSVGGRASGTPGLLTSRLGGCRSPSLGASLSLLFGQSAVQCHVSGTAGTWTSATTQLIPSPGQTRLMDHGTLSSKPDCDLRILLHTVLQRDTAD